MELEGLTTVAKSRFLAVRFVQPPPIAQTRFCDAAQKPPESGWGVVCHCFVPFSEYPHYLSEVYDDIGITFIGTEWSFYLDDGPFNMRNTLSAVAT